MGASPKYKIYIGSEYIGSFKQSKHAELFCNAMQQKGSHTETITLRDGHDRTASKLSYPVFCKVELINAAIDKLEQFGPSGGGIMTLEEIKDHYESMTPAEYQDECKRLNTDDRTELIGTILDNEFGPDEIVNP